VERQELIDRIVEEKGAEAVPLLLDLMVSEDDETAQICFEALLQLGERTSPELLKRLREGGEDISMLYLADLAGELGDKKAVPYLYDLLRRFDEEGSQAVIYEALARLGEGSNVAGILSLLLQDSDDESSRDQLIMAISQTASPEGMKTLARMYSDAKLDKSTRAFVLEGLHMLLSSDAKLKDVLLELDNGKEIIERLYIWQKEI
jgi:HEAT repeat protein